MVNGTPTNGKCFYQIICYGLYLLIIFMNVHWVEKKEKSNLSLKLTRNHHLTKVKESPVNLDFPVKCYARIMRIQFFINENAKRSH
jgi:hypothetical protein